MSSPRPDTAPFDWHEPDLTVGQVADRMTIAPSAVRYYADQQLLPHRRTSGNQRRFLPDVLCRVAMIRASQRVGLSIEEIREALAELPPGEVPGPEDWARLSRRLETVARGRVDEMLRVLAELTGATGPV